MRTFLSLFAALCAASVPAAGFASAVVETADRVEVDYSKQRVRFYGESNLKPEDGEDAAKAAERRARNEGFEHFQAASAKILPFKTEGLRNKATSYVTNYYADGAVRVYLETSLTDVAPKDLGFARQDLADTSALTSSGVVFSLDKKAQPSALYQIVDEAGTVLFEAKDMSQAAFQQVLMGKWLQKPADRDLAAVVGPKPVRLALASAGPGKVQVSRAAWDDAMKDGRPLLVNGRVALLVP
jgi:hypothetical protein